MLVPDRRAIVVSAVLPYPITSGGHRRTMRLIEAIDRVGGTPHLLTTDAGELGGAEELRSRGWIVEILNEPSSTPMERVRQHLARRPTPILRTVAARLAVLAPQAAFVQFEHTQSAYYWDAIAGTKCVLSLHNVDSQMLASVTTGASGMAKVRAASRAQAMRALERRAVPRADAVLVVSEHDRAHFEPLSARVLTVPNGIDDEYFQVPAALPPSEDVLFFGHFDYPPNQLGVKRFLLEGWPRLAALRPDARLLLAGKGMSAELLEMLAGEERVVPLGFVPDLAELLERSRLVLVPIWHGGGTKFKVLESMASSRPIVSTPEGVDGIGFEDDRHGLLADDPAELAELAARLLGDLAHSSRLAGAARELADRYRWPRVLEPAESLYSSWLGTSHRN